MIEGIGLSKSFGMHVVFDSFSFRIEDGEHVALSAPSGTGKTTLFRILSGLEKPDRGTLTGADPAKIGYLFQEPRLFPQLTAVENVACVAPSPKNALNQAREWLARVGLASAERFLPGELSGGMRQRVALARTLFSDRPVLLLDEPFTALDPELHASIRLLVRDCCRDKTLILASHIPEDLEILTDRRIELPIGSPVSGEMEEA